MAVINHEVYMMASCSDTWVKIGEIKEVEPTAEPIRTENLVGTIYPTGTISIDFTPFLDRKSRKAWAKVFDMPKWMATEWINPRKKKRGTMRRKRWLA